MESHQGSSLQPLKKTDEWQKLIDAINQCYNNAVKNSKRLEEVAAKMDDQTLIKQIEILEYCHEPLASNEVQMKAGFFTSFLLQSYAKNKSYAETTKYYFLVLFNFKISHKIKRFFLKSVGKFRIIWREELGMLFEQALVITMQMIERLQTQGSKGTHCQAISVENSESIYTIEINWPEQRNEVYSSLVVLGNLLLQKLEEQQQSYVVELARIIRKLTQLILKNEFLERETKLVEELLDLWKQLIVQDFEICEDDERQKQRKYNKVLHQVTTWGDVYEGMIRVLTIYSQSIYQQDLDQEIYNYLKLEQNVNSQIYYTLKQKAAISNIPQYLVLSELIIIDSQKFDIQKISSKYVSQVVWSIIETIQKMVGQKHLLDLQQQATCLQIFELFSAVLGTPVKISQVQAKHLLEQILIPLFESYLDDTLELYTRDTEMFITRIEDCIEAQQQGFMTSKIAKVIESLAGRSNQNLCMLYEYVIRCLKVNKAQALKLDNQEQFIHRNIKNTTCFVLLGILSCQSENLLDNLDSLKEIFVIDYIALLSEIQVALIYEYFRYIDLDYFAEQEISGQLIDSTLVEEMSAPLRIFAINLLVDISKRHFTQDQVFRFVNLYEKFKNISLLYAVLESLINQRLQMFTPECFLKIIENSIEVLDKQLRIINYNVKNHLQYDAFQVFNCLRTCQRIAKQESILYCEEEVVQKLWILVQQIQNVEDISFDNDLLKIGSCLLENTKKLPQNLQLIEKVIEAFNATEYSSFYYFQFFYKVYQLCNQETFQLACTIQDMMMQVMSLFVIHPEYSLLTLDNLISLSNSLWVVQFMLADKLNIPLRFWNDIKENVIQFPKLIEYVSQQPILIVRLLNLRLAFTQQSRNLGLDGQQKDSFDYALITDLANRKKIYGYQAKLLVYTLTNLLPDIKCGGEPTIWAILIYLLRTDNERIANLQQRNKDEKEIKFLKLLSLVIPPFVLQRTLKQQILLFVETFRQKDTVSFLDSVSKLTQESLEELNSNLKVEINHRRIVKVTEIKINQAQQPKPDTSIAVQKVKSILRSDKDENDIQSLKKRMRALKPFNKSQAPQQSEDEQEISLFAHGNNPLKKLCPDRSQIKRIDSRTLWKVEQNETKKDLVRQKSQLRRKYREFQYD